MSLLKHTHVANVFSDSVQARRHHNRFIPILVTPTQVDITFVIQITIRSYRPMDRCIVLSQIRYCFVSTLID